MEEHEVKIFTRLLLIRHGQTAQNIKHAYSGWNEMLLNETGHQQAHLIAQRLKRQYPVDVLYASPLKRAIQTAEYIGKAFDLSINTNQDLLEYGFGDLSDQEVSLLKDTNPELYQEINAWQEAPVSNRPSRPTIPAAESFEQFKHRIQSFTDLILKEHKGKHIAAVSHGGFIRSFVYYHVGGDFSKYVPFWADNTSLTIIDFYNGNPTISLFNDISHTSEQITLGYPRLL